MNEETSVRRSRKDVLLTCRNKLITEKAIKRRLTERELEELVKLIDKELYKAPPEYLW